MRIYFIKHLADQRTIIWLIEKSFLLSKLSKISGALKFI